MKKIITSALLALALLPSVSFADTTMTSVLVATPLVAVTADAQRDQQIAVLKGQIASLKAQMDSLTSTTSAHAPVGWCHKFERNIRSLTAAGVETDSLKTALNQEGMTTTDLKSAVIAFQEKYAADILVPNALVRGNGFVGVATRAKLNALYGCHMTAQ